MWRGAGRFARPPPPAPRWPVFRPARAHAAPRAAPGARRCGGHSAHFDFSTRPRHRSAAGPRGYRRLGFESAQRIGHFGPACSGEWRRAPRRGTSGREPSAHIGHARPVGAAHAPGRQRIPGRARACSGQLRVWLGEPGVFGIVTPPAAAARSARAARRRRASGYKGASQRSPAPCQHAFRGWPPALLWFPPPALWGGLLGAHSGSGWSGSPQGPH